MAKRRFVVNFEGYIEIELDDAVIDVVDDDWRDNLYDLNTPEEIAAHIAYNFLRGAALSNLDGWADQPNSNAVVIEQDIYEVGSREIEEV